MTSIISTAGSALFSATPSTFLQESYSTASLNTDGPSIFILGLSDFNPLPQSTTTVTVTETRRASSPNGDTESEISSIYSHDSVTNEPSEGTTSTQTEEHSPTGGQPAATTLTANPDSQHVDSGEAGRKGDPGEQPGGSLHPGETAAAIGGIVAVLGVMGAGVGGIWYYYDRRKSRNATGPASIKKLECDPPSIESLELENRRA